MHDKMTIYWIEQFTNGFMNDFVCVSWINDHSLVVVHVI